MIISLDYDDTYTNDPVFWNQFIGLAKAYGHEVICVTSRRDTMDNRADMEIPVEKILFAYDAPKKDYANWQGVKVDVWIDDNPHRIVSA